MAQSDNTEEEHGNTSRQVREDIPNTKGTEYNRNIFHDPRRISTLFFEIKTMFLEVRGKHNKTILLIVNFLGVLIVTAYLTKLFSGCGVEPDIPNGDAIVCKQFTPVDHISVEMDLNQTSHCYSSQSCVALGGTLRQQQGEYRYNFIIGAHGFVFTELGYKCRAENSSGLLIRLPVDSIFGGRDLMAAHKAVDKLVELVREGLECGLVLPKYSVSATGCGRDDPWCSAVLKQVLAEESPDKASSTHQFFDDNEKGNIFYPLDIKRAYNFQQKLVVCQVRHT